MTIIGNGNVMEVADAAADTIIRGISIENYQFIYVSSPSSLISHCHIKNYSGPGSGGIYIYESTVPVSAAVEYCEIETVDNGIIVNGVVDVTIYSNHIHSNNVSGVKLMNGGKAKISENSIHGNGPLGGDNIIWEGGQPPSIAPIIVTNPTPPTCTNGFEVSMTVEVPSLPATYLPANYIIEAFSHTGSPTTPQLSTYQDSKTITGTNSVQTTTMTLPCLDAEYITLTGTVESDAGESETVPMLGTSIQLSDANCQCSQKHPSCPQFCSAIGAFGDCPDLTSESPHSFHCFVH